jgi:hypothetical protein
MIDVGNAIRKAVAREVAPLLADCEWLRAEIDDAEDYLPEIPDRHERAVARVEVIMRRAELEAIISELQGDDLVERVTRLVRERWPQWRI